MASCLSETDFVLVLRPGNRKEGDNISLRERSSYFKACAVQQLSATNQQDSISSPLTSRSCVLLEKLPVAQLPERFHNISCILQDPSTVPYPLPAQCRPYQPILPLQDPVFQKELYNFESLYKFIRRTCTVF
jgi:hypothetical protein